jgi:hypothetical protein
MRVIFKYKMREELCASLLAEGSTRVFIHPFFSLFLLERKKEFLVVIFTSSFLHALLRMDPFGCISLSSAQLSSAASVLHSFPNSTCCLFTSGLAEEEEEEEGLFFFVAPIFFPFPFHSFWVCIYLLVVVFFLKEKRGLL